jgi:hypothetical protein
MPTLLLTTTAIPNPRTGTAYRKQFFATGGTAPYTWSYTGTLPPGTVFGAAFLTGTPTTGSYNFTVRVTDAVSATDSRTFTGTILPALVTDGNLGRISGPLLADNLLRNGVDLAFETDLLYLQVSPTVQGTSPLEDGDPNWGSLGAGGLTAVGINTNTPSRSLEVNGTTSVTSLIVDTQAEIADLTFVSNYIQNPSGSIIIRPNQASSPEIKANEIQTAALSIRNTIATRNLDDNIELSSNGTGQVVFTTSKVNVNGNLHATGNITWDGNIVLGNNNLDNVVFDADINSSIIPNVNNSFDLGTTSKRWRTLYSTNVTAGIITIPSLTVNNIDMLLTPGNTIYVSINGNDTNLGTHQHSTYRTIKKALSVATAGTTVFIYPGVYSEIFPLTVPAGVSVRGTNIRSVAVRPTDATKFKDAFLLNGETTISDLTVGNFYYDSVNDTGYGFRLAPNCLVTTRSPYVQNVTVLNNKFTISFQTIIDGEYSTSTIIDILDGGSSSSSFIDITDGNPGLAPANSGRGALVDGSVVNANSKEATILFQSVTFIIPDADGIIATNGARVEWLNSFTYYANRGIYLSQGTLGFASLGVKFGAEMRSIGSANVYGIYGAVADGANTLGYLVGHNFGYIGSGANSQNDDRLTLQANEVVELNSGKIYYDSMDHKGNYRVGNIFLVDQQTGDITLNAQSISFTAGGNITLTGPTTETIVDATKVQTGNIRIYDNTVSSLAGPVNFSAFSGKTYLNTNVNVTGLVNVTGNSIVTGNVFLGDTPYDIVTISPKLTQNINPGTTNTYTLGQKTPTDNVWNTGFLTGINVDGVTQFTNNTISTLTGNNDLRLVAAGTGKIQITSTDVQLNQNLTVANTLTVDGTTNLKGTSILGNVLLTGNIGQTGNTYIIGLFDNNNIEITGAASYISVPNIQVQYNNINATATNANLQFTGNGSAGVIFDNNLKIIDNTISNVSVGAITNLDKSIVFSPNGTGNLVVNSTNFLQLPYSNNTTKILSASGEIRQNLTTGDYEGYLNTGNESFTNVYSSNKLTYITPELTIGTNDNILRFVSNGTVRATINSTQLYTSAMQAGNFIISGNTINNPFSGSDILLSPTSGVTNINNILFGDNTITNPSNSAFSINSTGLGYVKFTGTGAIVMAIGDTSGRRAFPELGEVRYNTQVNYLEVYDGNNWIPAVGTSGAAPLSEILDIMDLWGLVLG